MWQTADPDQTLSFVAYDLHLRCLLRPICSNTYGKYGILGNMVNRSGPKVIKLFFILNSADHIFLLINIKMPTIVGIFIFISREIFMLSSV